MKTYLVGGAVRDKLLGLAVKDKDWVVVGSTPEAMLALGFQAVGKDFPVFLHPKSKEEYALARTERKTAKGYHGFAFYAAPEVRIEEDLARRDLTINAIAQDETGALIDPYGGQVDIAKRVLRHVSPAFAEDPVRILRLARFAARYPDFSIAPETMQLMQSMVTSGEVDALVAERVWQELAKGLMEAKPSRMLLLLRECGALQKLLPEVDQLFGVPQRADYHPEVDTGAHLMLVLDMASQLQAPLSVRYACLCHDLGKGSTPADILPRHLGHEERSVKLARKQSERLRVPSDCKELAEVVAREHGNIHRAADGFGAAALLRLLQRCDALRRPERFAEVLLACECDARGRLGLQDHPYSVKTLLQQTLSCALAVETASIAQAAQQQGLQAEKIGELITEARVKAIEKSLQHQQSL